MFLGCLYKNARKAVSVTKRTVGLIKLKRVIYKRVLIVFLKFRSISKFAKSINFILSVFVKGRVNKEKKKNATISHMI